VVPVPPPLDGVSSSRWNRPSRPRSPTRQLADLGARVIKVERPDGGDFARQFDTLASGLGAHFTWLNRSKESLTLDVKTPDGHAVLLDLLAAPTSS